MFWSPESENGDSPAGTTTAPGTTKDLAPRGACTQTKPVSGSSKPKRIPIAAIPPLETPRQNPYVSTVTGPESPIVVVSGLPRSGTSLMMQMLSAGGLPVLTDGERTPDPDNPRGYLELERVKQLKSDTSWLTSAGGHAVKIIHLLLQDLPPTHQYDVLFMERDIGEVLRSQAAMLARSGRTGAPLPPERLAAVYRAQLATVRQWLAERPCFRVHSVGYAELVANPEDSVRAIRNFLRAGSSLDGEAMRAAVDPSLYRNR